MHNLYIHTIRALYKQHSGRTKIKRPLNCSLTRKILLQKALVLSKTRSTNSECNTGYTTTTTFRYSHSTLGPFQWHSTGQSGKVTTIATTILSPFIVPVITKVIQAPTFNSTTVYIPYSCGATCMLLKNIVTSSTAQHSYLSQSYNKYSLVQSGNSTILKGKWNNRGIMDYSIYQPS